MDIKCNLILDSCCDLPHDVVNRDGVYLLNFPYFDNEGEHLDDLYQTQSAHDFFESMRNGNEPHTAQVPMPAIQKAYQWAIDQGVPTVYLSFSSGLSGTYDTAAMLLEQMKADNPEIELYIVDTKLASVAEALLVYEALNQREKGLTAQEMVTWAEEVRYFVDAQFMVDDLEALRRGGRIPSSVAFAGSKLDVKPLLGIDMEGKLALTGVARGRKKGVKSLVDYWKKRRADEGPVQNGGGVALQGVSPQPAAPVRPDLLSGVPGRGEAGRRAGAQLHRDHPHLPDLHRRGARPAAGTAGADRIGQTS